MNITKHISHFKANEMPRLQLLKNYYEGKHNILHKYTGDNKPNAKIITNFCKLITDTTTGYWMGRGVKYDSADEALKQQIALISDYNFDNAVNYQHASNLSKYGRSYELLWIDTDKQLRYAALNPLEVIPIYSNDLDGNLDAAIRFYTVFDAENDSEITYIEHYTATEVTYYESREGELQLIESKEHQFGAVPIIEFINNDLKQGDYEQIISLQDAYNEMQSLTLDDFNYFADAYLVISGMQVDEDTARTIRQDRILVLDEGGTASWLTKAQNDAYVENMKTRLYRDIYSTSATVDMQKEGFGTQSGVAIRYQLLPMENRISGTERFFTMGIEKRWDLIIHILNVLGNNFVNDIQVIYNRDLPINESEIASMITQLQGLVSSETLLAQLPFIQDAAAEVEAIRKEKQENIQLYNFQNINAADIDANE